MSGREQGGSVEEAGVEVDDGERALVPEVFSGLSTMREAAKALGTSRWTILGYLQAHPSIFRMSVGGATLVRVDDLEGLRTELEHDRRERGQGQQ